jgi:hypothetical protein
LVETRFYGDKQDRKSTSSYLFKFLNAPISSFAKKQPMVALSTCESEYIACCLAAWQAVWLESILKEMEIEVSRPIDLFIDNKSVCVIHNLHNSIFSFSLLLILLNSNNKKP